MRKLTLLLSLLLSVGLAAQVVKPKVLTGSTKTLYKFRSNAWGGYIIAQTGANAAPFKGSNNGNATPTLFSFEDAGEEDVYYIKSEEFDAYLSYDGVGKNETVTTKTEKSDTEKWKLIRKSESERAMAIIVYRDKDETTFSNRLGLNTQGDANGNIVLWETASTNGASFYQIEEVETAPVFNAITLPETSWTDGWYQIRTTQYSHSSGTAHANKYASCVSSGEWIFTLEETNKNLSTLVYIYKDNNYHMKSATGKYANNDVKIVNAPGNLNFTTETITTDNNPDPTLIKISGGNQVWTAWNGTPPFIGSASTGDGSWRLQLSSADDYLESINYKAYTVNITGAPDGTTPTVTYTKDGYTGVSTVYDGGTFFAENISKEEITADGVTDRYIYSVNIDGENSTITVNFSINYEKLISELVAEIDKFGKQVGYPGTVSTELTAASNTAQEDPTEENYNALLSTLNSVWENINDMANIKKPEDGKVYKIAGITLNGTIRNLYVDGSTVKWKTEEVNDASGYFICQNTPSGVKFAAATASGLFNEGDTSGGNFISDNGTIFYFDLKKAKYLGHTMLIVQSGTQYRTIGTNNENKLVFWTRDNTEDSPLYDTVEDNYSTDFVFEEVEVSESGYAGFSATVAEGSNGNYGTLCLPFASIVPDGVTVNGVEASGDNELTVMPLDLTNGDGGKILPAGTPVLLQADNDGTYTFKPAAANQEAAKVTGLQGTFAAKAVREETAYILAHTDEPGSEIKFFLLGADDDTTVNANKAYYVPQAGTNAQALSLHFGTTTGLAEAAQTPDAPTAVYDLSGRQVGKATRGLYIVGGRKVLVK